MTAVAPELDEVTHDTLLCGRVKLIQPARGFRSSLDPVLLAGFLEAPFGRFLDIGCGTGAVSFLLLARDPAASGVGIEIQPRLARLSARAVRENGFEGRFGVREGDVRGVALPAAGFDLVVTNPPFQPLGLGPLPPDAEKSIAHHEVKLTLDDWLGVAARTVRPDGRVGVVLAAGRLGEVLRGAEARGLAPARVRLVHPRPGEPATRFLLEARRGASRTLVIEAPLFLHDEGGYTTEVRRFLGETIT